MMNNLEDYIASIINSINAIRLFSFTDKAKTLETLKRIDGELDTLRNYLEGK